MLTRREFMSRASMTLALTPILCAACSSSGSSASPGSSTSTNPTTPRCDGVFEMSTVVLAHSRTLQDVTLTAAQLAAIEAGQSVTVTTSSAAAHTHGFTLQAA